MMAEDETKEVEEEAEEECPKCPPVGAPAWMATFADMASFDGILCSNPVFCRI